MASPVPGERGLWVGETLAFGAAPSTKLRLVPLPRFVGEEPGSGLLAGQRFDGLGDAAGAGVGGLGAFDGGDVGLPVAGGQLVPGGLGGGVGGECGLEVLGRLDDAGLVVEFEGDLVAFAAPP